MNFFFKETNLSSVKDSFVVLDVDGCLVPDKGNILDSETVERVRFLTHNRNEIVIISNHKDHIRNKNIASSLGVRYLETELKKPDFRLVKNIKRLNHKNLPVVVIGDKYLTDGVLALILKSSFIRVRHLPNDIAESLITKVSYWIDDTVYKIIPFIRLSRPIQWVKNFLVFLPLIFVGHLFYLDEFLDVIIGFVAFSLVASSVYVINDILDVDQDKLHPRKKNRPIASGEITISSALVFLSVLLVASLLMVVQYGANALILIIGYFLLNIIYSFKLKHWPGVDIVLISIFYLARVLFGGFIVGVHVSSWLMVCTLLLAIFIISGKRLAEYKHKEVRLVLRRYNYNFLRVLSTVAALGSIMSYGLYTLYVEAGYLMWMSNIPAVLGVGRFLYLSGKGVDTESPELLVFKDVIIMTCVVIWATIVLVVFMP